MKQHKIIFFVCLITTIILLVSGFCVPPTGIIDPSVLTGCGILFGFATLGTLPYILEGRSAKLTHGNTSLEVGDND